MDNATVKDVLLAGGRHELPMKVHVVTKAAPVKEVMETFYRYHIHAVPVIDFESRCEGLVDILDVLSFLVQVTTEPLLSRVTPLSTHLRTDDLGMLVERSGRFNAANVVERVNQSTKNPFLPCTLGAPLLEVMRCFAHGLHRVPVVEADNPTSVIAVLTQTDVNQFLADDTEKYLGHRLAGSSVESLGLVCGPEALESVTTETKAIDAFLTMHEKGLSALAVVNSDGTFHGCLSATDLKLITDFRFQALLLPVGEFLAHVRKEEGRLCKNYRVWCSPATPLKTVITKLAEERVHRAFVVDQVKFIPLGVVSLTDIARVVVRGH